VVCGLDCMDCVNHKRGIPRSMNRKWKTSGVDPPSPDLPLVNFVIWGLVKDIVQPRVEVLDRPWGPLSLQYNGYRVFPAGKAAGAWCWPPTPPSTEVENEQSYTSTPLLGPWWSVIGWPLPQVNFKVATTEIYQRIHGNNCVKKTSRHK
jgi:hypothetical protein